MRVPGLGGGGFKLGSLKGSHASCSVGLLLEAPRVLILYVPVLSQGMLGCSGLYPKALTAPGLGKVWSSGLKLQELLAKPTVGILDT